MVGAADRPAVVVLAAADTVVVVVHVVVVAVVRLKKGLNMGAPYAAARSGREGCEVYLLVRDE